MTSNLHLLCLLLICSVIGSCYGQDCKFANFDFQPNFNLQKYLGKWYEMKWLPQQYIADEHLFRDYAHNYVLESNGTITGFIKGRDPGRPDKCFRYHSRLTTTSTPGKLLFARKEKNKVIQSDYWIILTDYDTFALIYGCRVPFSNGTCDEADSWVWSRTRSLPQSTWDIIDRKISQMCLDPTSYLVTKQENECPECRYKLTDVMTKFDTNKYVGDWYKLRAYNSTSRIDMTDIVHKYSLDSDDRRLKVQILSRKMDKNCTLVTETTYLHTSNNPGKLVLDQMSTKSDYWVTTTDYNNYAIVYSCLLPGTNFTCARAELTVYGRKTTLNPSIWMIVKQKVENVCLYLQFYVDIRHGRDCITSSGARYLIDFQEILIYLIGAVVAIHRI